MLAQHGGGVTGTLTHGGTMAARTLARCAHTEKRKKSTFPPPTFTKVRFSFLNSKTGQITSLNFSNRAFYLPGAVSKAVLLQ
jgi:hypothetical protein